MMARLKRKQFITLTYNILQTCWKRIIVILVDSNNLYSEGVSGNTKSLFPPLCQHSSDMQNKSETKDDGGRRPSGQEQRAFRNLAQKLIIGNLERFFYW